MMENTTVIKMMKGLERWCETPVREHHEEELDNLFEEPSFSIFHPGSLSTRKKRSSAPLLISASEKADLIASKSKSAKLEFENESLRRSHKVKSEIAEEKMRMLRASMVANEEDEIFDLRRRCNTISERKKSASEELADLEKKHKEMKDEFEKKISSLEKANFDLKNSLFECQCGKDTELSELKEKYNAQKQELSLTSIKLEELETKLDTNKTYLEEKTELVSDYLDLRSRCQAAEQNVKMLEQKLAQKDEASILAERNQKELANYRILQNENKALREDNRLYRDSASNILILEEQLSSLKAKLKDSDTLKEKFQKLEFENEELLKKLKKWEAPDSSGANVKARSPGELTRVICELQSNQFELSRNNVVLEVRNKMCDNMLESNQNEMETTMKQVREITVQKELLEDKLQKLQRRLILVTTERDGLRRVLSNYENEEGSPKDILLEQAEERVNQYSSQINKLEDYLESVKLEVSNQKNQYMRLQQEYQQLEISTKTSQSNIQSKVEVQSLKEQLADVKQKFEKVTEEKEILELRLETRKIQGEYDPLKTKLLHLTYNPTATKREEYDNKIKEISDENEKLRKTVIQMQEERKEELEESLNVSRLIKSSKPMEEALKQVDQWKMRYKRLEEEFKKGAQEFRNAVKYLLGYSFKEIRQNEFRLQNLCCDNPDDSFVLKCAKNKDGSVETAMVDTQYTKNWLELIDTYIHKGDSIPAFLAAVNLELFQQDQQQMY